MKVAINDKRHIPVKNHLKEGDFLYYESSDTPCVVTRVDKDWVLICIASGEVLYRVYDSSLTSETISLTDLTNENNHNFSAIRELKIEVN